METNTNLIELAKKINKLEDDIQWLEAVVFNVKAHYYDETWASINDDGGPYTIQDAVDILFTRLYAAFDLAPAFSYDVEAPTTWLDYGYKSAYDETMDNINYIREFAYDVIVGDSTRDDYAEFLDVLYSDLTNFIKRYSKQIKTETKTKINTTNTDAYELVRAILDMFDQF